VGGVLRFGADRQGPFGFDRGRDLRRDRRVDAGRRPRGRGAGGGRAFAAAAAGKQRRGEHERARARDQLAHRAPPGLRFDDWPRAARPRKYKAAGGVQLLLTESPNVLPALRATRRRISNCVCTSRSVISKAESTTSCLLGALLPRNGSASSTVSRNLRTASDAARCPSSKDFSSSRGRPVLRPRPRRPPAARDAPAAAEAAGFAAAFVPALRLAF